MVKATKKLIIVCDEKTEQYANYLRQLISTNDDKDGEVVGIADGSVLAVGKGNPEWNYSAPHGAGRLMSRTKAKANLSMDEYRETMKGIYTTSINENTLDEAPMAYKSLEDIIDVIRESVDVIDVMKPIYNYKASD